MLAKWHRRVTGAMLLGLLVGATATAWAGDWPAYRHDVGRSSATDEKLVLPLQSAWVYRFAQPPQPAWPEPFHIVNRLDFDYAPHPVVAGGLVYFGSSSDDTIRALDLKTGAEKWHFITGGPVRFSPQIADGKAYAGSDDGLVYCLEAGTGKLLWKFRAGPDDDMFVGNRRMISRWPVRTGVLVMEGRVYFAAGMWNADGIHVCALNADTGAVVWRNDNAAYTGVFFKGNAQPRTTPVTSLPKNTTHEGEFGATGITPQGALLADGDQLLIPNGIAFPSRFNRQTGEYKPWEKTFSPAPGMGGITGGTWGCIDNGYFYTLEKYRQNVLGLFSVAVASTGRKGTHRVRAILPQVGVRPTGLGIPPSQKNYIHDKGKASIVVSNGKAYSRHSYALALSGDTLLVGLDGAVVAQDRVTEKELWRAPVEGIAREIAVADGHVLVSTERGVVHCFEAASPKNSGKGALKSPFLDAVKPALPINFDVEILEPLKKTGMDRGFALVLGDADAKFSLALANATQLKVVSVLSDDAAVSSLRDRVLTTTALYGSRIQVLSVSRLDRLPFARYFANAVVVAGPVAGLSGRELYRVLHPYGGVLLAPGLKPEETAALVKECGASTEEIGNAGTAVTRGPLIGALDWDGSVPSDRLVRGPMRVMWFGGPDTAQTQCFRQNINFPAVASGRYLVLGEKQLSSVDAYNGTVQWSRVIPRKNRDVCEVDGVVYWLGDSRSKQAGMDETAQQTGGGRGIRIASAEKAYLVLGREPGDIWIQLDTRTGQQQRVLGKWTPPAIYSLRTPQTWPIEQDATHSGEVTLEASATGVIATLVTKDPALSRLDVWDLCFDFRPIQKRYGLYERGAFQFTVIPSQNAVTPAACAKGNGPVHPRPQVTGDLTSSGTKTTVMIPWAELEMITGSRPTSFGFAATLNAHDDSDRDRIVRHHLFGDWASEALNKGWANVFIGEAPASVEPPIIFEPLTREARKQNTGKSASKNQGVVDDPTALGPRIHPLTGDLEPKLFRSGTAGCGGPYYSSTARFGRSTGMLGLYDFIDDSGLRNLCGIKAGCTTPITPALGVVIVSPEGGHCVCTFPFATTVTLAPADRRLNEDWALFHDRPADTLVRQAAINLGAFGDRRDEQGTLWLGFPRAPEKGLDFSFAAGKNHALAPSGVWLRYSPPAFQVPLEIEYLDPAKGHRSQDDVVDYGYWSAWSPNRLGKEFGPYRVNTDIVHVAGTDRPWIYGSGCRGIKKATLQLDFRNPLIASAAITPPVIDGATSDPTWGDKPDTLLPSTKTQVFLRQDADHLYVAMKRPAVVSRKGTTAPWSKTTKGEDANVWEDDSCEVFLTDTASGKVVHLGVSASGARYDALAHEAPPQKEDPQWNGVWSSATTGDESALSFEVAIPLKTLTDAGLRKDRLGINVQMNQKNVSGEVYMYPGAHGRDPRLKGTSGEALSFLGFEGREHCRNFTPLGIGVPAKIEPRKFTVRLHFAELDDVQSGRRVFDVKLQDRIVLENFDVVRATGGPRLATVREFQHIQATGALTIEFVSKVKTLMADTAPILSALEVVDEAFDVPLRGRGG